MKNTLKTLGIICIIVAALFIAACGDLLGGDNFTVTFNSNGGSSVPSQTVAKDGTAFKPPDPTKRLTQGLYKGNAVAKATFVTWLKEDGTPYDFSTPVTGNLDLLAQWNDPTPETLPSTGAPDDIVSKAVKFIKDDNNRNSTTKYTLVLGDDVKAKGVITLEDANTDLIIISFSGRKEITPDFTNTGTNLVFLTVGKSSDTDPSIKLTLDNIALKGRADAVADSLVRVRSGASLIVDNGSSIYGHKNKIGDNTSDGEHGNGSAVCIVSGGVFTIKGGSTIERNESTGTKQPNRNLVGGVYGFNGKINIEGGQIFNNECPSETVSGEKVYIHTRDIYVIENCELTISGSVKIGELTLNIDYLNSSGSSGPTKNAFIKIPSSVSNDIDKLCLRSSEPQRNSGTSATNALTNTKNKWKNQVVLQGIEGYSLSSMDVARFHLGEFRGTTSFKITNNSDKISDTFKIADSGTNIGRLVDK